MGKRVANAAQTKAVCAAIEQGTPRARALLAYEIDAAFYAEIAALAEDPIAAEQPTCAAFMTGMDQAEARFEVACNAKIAQARDWRAAALMLSQRFPERYGRAAAPDADAELRRIFHAAEEALDEASYVRLLERVSGLDGSRAARRSPGRPDAS